MIKNLDDVQKMSKDSLDASMKSFGAFSKTSQAITDSWRLKAPKRVLKAFDERR